MMICAVVSSAPGQSAVSGDHWVSVGVRVTHLVTGQVTNGGHQVPA